MPLPADARHIPSTLSAAQALLAQQQTELEQLRQHHEAMLRAMAHDLRAPLRHITSFAPLLCEAVDALATTTSQESSSPQTLTTAHAIAEAREFATMMAQSARRMSRMVDGLAKISRAARAPLQLHTVDWSSLCNDVIGHLQHGDKSVPIQWQNPCDQVLLHADQTWLRTMMEELLDNAIKFSARQHQPVVRLSATAQSHGSHWQLMVQDNGVGFEDSVLHHGDPQRPTLFQPFQRAHRDTDFDGIGCGLALVQTIAQRHGAQVHIAARLDQGCTVTVQWPAAINIQ